MEERLIQIEDQNEQSETALRQQLSLQTITQAPFIPHATRENPFVVGAITVTEVCNLSCVMCHFNGPKAPKKAGTLLTSQVESYLTQVPKETEMWFAATGELFLDPNAVYYLRRAFELGLKPCVLSHGQQFTPELLDQVLEAGVRMVRMSVDTTDAELYRKIRRGGEFYRILEACTYLRESKKQYPGLRVEINATLFKNTFPKQDEMIEFWRGKVDQVNFNAEYHDTFRFRNTFFVPERRNDCRLQLLLVPSGRIAPCCAMQVHQHYHDLTWLPHIDEVSLEDAYTRLCDMYDDPSSPLGKICKDCDWWILNANYDAEYKTPYLRCVPLEPVP